VIGLKVKHMVIFSEQRLRHILWGSERRN